MKRLTFKKHFQESSMKIAGESMQKASEYLARESAAMQGKVNMAREAGTAEGVMEPATTTAKADSTC